MGTAAETPDGPARVWAELTATLTWWRDPSDDPRVTQVMRAQLAKELCGYPLWAALDGIAEVRREAQFPPVPGDFHAACRKARARLERPLELARTTRALAQHLADEVGRCRSAGAKARVRQAADDVKADLARIMRREG